MLAAQPMVSKCRLRGISQKRNLSTGQMTCHRENFLEFHTDSRHFQQHEDLRVANCCYLVISASWWVLHALKTLFPMSYALMISCFLRKSGMIGEIGQNTGYYKALSLDKQLMFHKISLYYTIIQARSFHQGRKFAF